MGIGTDIAALYGRGLLDVAIINREIDEATGAECNGNGLGEDTTVLYREGRVWAALRGMKFDSDQPIPLAVPCAPCAWRQLAQERLQSAGRRWTVALQSTGLSGIVTAVEAGLAISIFAQSGLSTRLRALGPAQGLPALPTSNTSFAGMPGRRWRQTVCTTSSSIISSSPPRCAVPATTQMQTPKRRSADASHPLRVNLGKSQVEQL
jgi:DNA-binding transcriptional LysR family regulator